MRLLTNVLMLGGLAVLRPALDEGIRTWVRLRNKSGAEDFHSRTIEQTFTGSYGDQVWGFLTVLWFYGDCYNAR